MTLTEREEQVLAAVDQQEVLSLLIDLVRRPSPNPPGQEGATAELIAERCRALGLEVTVEEIEPGRPNVYARAGGPKDGLLFLVHTDTLPAGPGWNAEPFAASVHDGRLYGRGACDMKAGIAATMAALGACLRTGRLPATPVTLAAVVDEEEGGKGVRSYLAQGRGARAVVVPEPTCMRTVTGCRGNCYVEVEVTGRAAHAGSPEQGLNAIHGAMEVVAGVRELDARLSPERHHLLGSARWSLGRIHGGEATAAIPDRCRISLDRRLLPGQTGEAARQEIASMLQGLRLEQQGFGAEATLLMEIPPFETRPTDPLITMAKAAAADVGAPDGPLEGWTAACDGGFVARDARIPVVVQGPGSIVDEAHRPNESVPIAEVVQAARAYALMMLRYA